MPTLAAMPTNIISSQPLRFTADQRPSGLRASKLPCAMCFGRARVKITEVNPVLACAAMDRNLFILHADQSRTARHPAVASCSGSSGVQPVRLYRCRHRLSLGPRHMVAPTEAALNMARRKIAAASTQIPEFVARGTRHKNDPFRSGWALVTGFTMNYDPRAKIHAEDPAMKWLDEARYQG